MFSLEILLFHPALLTPRRSGFTASLTSRLAATACTTSGPHHSRMRTRAANDAARRRTAGGPADSSKARALRAKFTEPRLPRLFSRLIDNPRQRRNRMGVEVVGGVKKREQFAHPASSSVRGRALAERMYAMKGRLAAEDVWPAVFSCAVIALVPSARS